MDFYLISGKERKTEEEREKNQIQVIYGYCMQLVYILVEAIDASRCFLFNQNIVMHIFFSIVVISPDILLVYIEVIVTNLHMHLTFLACK